MRRISEKIVFFVLFIILLPIVQSELIWVDSDNVVIREIHGLGVIEDLDLYEVTTINFYINKTRDQNKKILNATKKA